MNRRSVAILALVVLLAVGLWWVRTNPSPSAAPTVPGESLTKVWVLDGDTFDATRPDGTTARVRILGIDAPEIAHDGAPAACGGEEAKAALVALLAGRTVTIATDPEAAATDQYGRTLAYVAAPAVDDIGLELVSTGMVAAWHPGSAKAPTRYAAYVAAQDTARTAGRGSWPTCGTLGR